MKAWNALGAGPRGPGDTEPPRFHHGHPGSDGAAVGGNGDCFEKPGVILIDMSTFISYLIFLLADFNILSLICTFSVIIMC